MSQSISFPTLPTVYVPEAQVHWQGEMAGEVTQHSVILQTRLTRDGKVRWGDVKGANGVGAFALSTQPDMSRAVRTDWLTADPEADYILKCKITDLEPGTRYYYALLSGTSATATQAGPRGTFQTLATEDTAQNTRFAVVTCMNQFAYQISLGSRKEGFPALAVIRQLSPDFVVFTGDNVYYDTPYGNRAKTLKSMRAKWHRQFSTERFRDLFLSTPTYWEKDDHDYRYNDADPYDLLDPSHELGVSVFREQVPVVDPTQPDAVTYRTHRINQLVQIWLLEGRDHRDPNTQLPGPNKTMWGETQKAWLKQTLQESHAPFKVIVSPTPLVGPDDTRVGTQGGIFAPLFGGKAPGQDDDFKRDNHTNVLGFRQEGEAFFDWLRDQGFKQGQIFIVCGDRHWQYHSIHPYGFDELSCGALLDANSRKGRVPGDPESTDPDGLIAQPYLQAKPAGGFLRVTVRPERGETPAAITFDFLSRQGEVRYSVTRSTQ